MKVLVAGGTGFIGSHLVDRLVKKGFDVVVPVRPSSNKKYLSSESVKIAEIDLLQLENVKGLLKGVDVLFNLASIRGSGWSFSDDHVYKVNVGITENLLKASLSENVKHYIQVSSVSVYGHPHGGPIKETHTCLPVNRYGKTKFASEQLIRKFIEDEGLPVTIIRPVITYGPRDTWGMVPKLIRLINANRYVTVGSGKNRVHLIYIDDLIEGLLRVMNNRVALKKTYHLAGAEPVEINQLVKIILSALDTRGPVFHVPTKLAWGAGCLMEVIYRLLAFKVEPVITRDKVDLMSRDRFFDIVMAKKDFDFYPKIDYNKGINKTLEWLKLARLI